MLTREDAYNLPFVVKQSLHEAKTELINKIFDDFESRTCGNCTHFIREHINVGSCRNGVCEDRFQEEPYVANGFGCTKFKRREDEEV